MNLLITSFLFSNESIQTWSSAWGHSAAIGSLQPTTFVSLYPSTVAQIRDPNWYNNEQGVIGSCNAASSSNKNGVATITALQQYSKSLTLDVPSTHACVLLDTIRNVLWLSADTVGSTPLWYAFRDGEYAATTDLLAVYHLGFQEPSSVPPGFSISIDLNTQEIISFAPHKETPGITQNTQIPEVHARRALFAALSALPHLNSAADQVVAVEVDAMDPSSQLLDCALDALQINRAVYYTKPLVADSYHMEESVFTRIIGEQSTSSDAITHNPQHLPSPHLLRKCCWDLSADSPVQCTRSGVS